VEVKVLDECEFVIFISTLACTLDKCYSDDELSVLAATLSQLGDTLATILAKRELCEKLTKREETIN
jgi:hypothetical protein